MQINRLLEIVYILFEKKRVTAKELAEHFEVSQRTIYRDLDVLSAAGIPVYASKGKGGGIRLLDNFVIRKSMFNEKEQLEILSSLQGMNALQALELEPVLTKLKTLFNKYNTNWIDVDFSQWGSRPTEKQKFIQIRTAIIHKRRIHFHYTNSQGKWTERRIEPYKLLFKGRAWYVYGYCTVKLENRMFRVTRINNLLLLEEEFSSDSNEEIWKEPLQDSRQTIKLVMKISSSLAHRVYDEFEQTMIKKDADGHYIARANFPEDEWLYGYVLSFGDYGEVLEPVHIRHIIREKLENNLKKYL